MSSKWINKDLFQKFQEEKKVEKEKPSQRTGPNRMEILWRPERGTQERPRVYEGRFLPDPNDNFYSKYYYHMFRSGDSWQFFLCPKTHNFENYCPFCSVTSKLYMGSAADKKAAYNYKRKERYVGNFFVVDDPRDAEKEDDSDKMTGKLKLYEFPGKVETKLKEEITDTRNGLGPSIFDPTDDGYNFILKIGATKPDQNKNVWPDYSSSVFARRSSAIGNEEEIEKIMEERHDLSEYIKTLERPEEDMINVLKQLMLWPLIKDEYARANKIEEESESVPDFDNKEEQAKEPKDESKDESEDDNGNDEDLSDEDLLKELEDL